MPDHMYHLVAHIPGEVLHPDCTEPGIVVFHFDFGASGTGEPNEKAMKIAKDLLQPYKGKLLKKAEVVYWGNQCSAGFIDNDDL